MTNKVKSMTGFGRGQREFSGGKFSVEIRTLNSKGLDLSMKVPSYCKSCEAQIRTLVTSRAMRGKVDFMVHIESAVGASTAGVINPQIFAQYHQQLSAISGTEGLALSDDALLSAILRMPEVLSTAKQQEISKEDTAVLMEAVTEALDSLDQHRLTEGEVLVADIMQRVQLIEDMAAQCAGFDAERVEGVRQRLTNALEKLKGVEYDKNRLEAELIYYLEKFDITEERVRLGQHINYFREIVADGGECGRKLGFILQEFGREINTTGSKANNSQMQRLVVGMKDEMEKIKEQSLNIL